jgi:hypothetical protein
MEIRLLYESRPTCFRVFGRFLSLLVSKGATGGRRFPFGRPARVPLRTRAIPTITKSTHTHYYYYRIQDHTFPIKGAGKSIGRGKGTTPSCRRPLYRRKRTMLMAEIKRSRLHCMHVQGGAVTRPLISMQMERLSQDPYARWNDSLH